MDSESTAESYINYCFFLMSEGVSSSYGLFERLYRVSVNMIRSGAYSNQPGVAYMGVSHLHELASAKASTIQQNKLDTIREQFFISLLN